MAAATQLNFFPGEVTHQVVVTIVQVSAAKDAFVKWGITPLQFAACEAAVNGIPRLVCFLLPLVPSLLDLF
jgi:hypothetical protein